MSTHSLGRSLLIFLLPFLCLLLFDFKKLKTPNHIKIGQENISFQYGDSITLVPYIHKDKPKVTPFDGDLEMKEYDLPFLRPHQKGVIVVHEAIPYEGVDSSVTIYNEKGRVIRKIKMKGGWVKVAPNHSIFIFVEERYLNEFTGYIEVYRDSGELVKRFKIDENSTFSGLDFDSRASLFAMGIDGMDGVSCSYLIYRLADNSYSEIELRHIYCSGKSHRYFDDSYILIMAVESQMICFALLSPVPILLGERCMAEAEFPFAFQAFSPEKSHILESGTSAKLSDNEGHSIEIKFKEGLGSDVEHNK